MTLKLIMFDGCWRRNPQGSRVCVLASFDIHSPPQFLQPLHNRLPPAVPETSCREVSLVRKGEGLFLELAAKA